MSYIEWVANNGMGRLRVYSDDILCGFDKLRGSMPFRHGNVMIEYEDRRTNQRITIIAEKCVVWEEDNQVYLQPMGRRVIHTESTSTSRTIPTSRRNQRPINVYTEV